MNEIQAQQSHLSENEQKTIEPFNLSVKEKEAISFYGNPDGLKQLAGEFRTAKTVNGTAQEFIDFSISFRQNEDNITACEILKRGVEFYTNDIELLASYLNCIIDSGIQEEIAVKSKEIYGKIRQNPLEDYSEYVFISVLKYLETEKSRSNELEKIKAEADKILNVFYKQHPNSEGSYFAHYKLISGREQRKDKLREAVNKLSSCSRCALRLADMLCEDGEHSEALKVIEKCLLSVQPLFKVNKAYVYYLRGICEYGVFQKNEKNNVSVNKRHFLTFFKKNREDGEQKNNEDKKTEVQNIYESFRIAKNEYFDLKSDYKKEIERIIYVLERQTGVFYS